MLGRTHMAIGALAGVAITPCLLHTHLPTFPAMAHINVKHGLSQWFINDALFVVSAVLGSTVPDFDQKDSLLSRKAEKLVQVITFMAIIIGILLLHLQSSVVAWGCGLVVGLMTVAQANLMRRKALGILAVGLLGMGITGIMPVSGSVCLAAWSAGAMFTAHRTFTHSLVGLVAFGIGVFSSVTQPHLSVMPWGAVLGYLMHMVADIPAGGIPLLWPWPVRQGGKFVKTSGVVDHIIGIAAIIGVVALVI